MHTYNLNCTVLLHRIAFGVLVGDSVSRLIGEATDEDLIGTKRVRSSSIHEVSSFIIHIGGGGGVRVEIRFRSLSPRVDAVSHLEKEFLLRLSLSIDRHPVARDNASVSGVLGQSETCSKSVRSRR